MCAQEALLALSLDVVVFVPVREAPHRSVEDDPGPEVRLRMCELATAPDERLEASRLELDRPGPSYTVDTLRELRAGAPEDELFLILGGDQAMSLPSWRAPDEALRLATVAAVERKEVRRETIVGRLAQVGGADRVVFFEMPRIDVSSTFVRSRVAAGRPIRYLVPDSVAELIEAEGLYRSSVAVAR